MSLSLQVQCPLVLPDSNWNEFSRQVSGNTPYEILFLKNRSVGAVVPCGQADFAKEPRETNENATKHVIKQNCMAIVVSIEYDVNFFLINPSKCWQFFGCTHLASSRFSLPYSVFLISRHASNARPF